MRSSREPNRMSYLGASSRLTNPSPLGSSNSNRENMNPRRSKLPMPGSQSSNRRPSSNVKRSMSMDRGSRMSSAAPLRERATSRQKTPQNNRRSRSSNASNKDTYTTPVRLNSAKKWESSERRGPQSMARLSAGRMSNIGGKAARDTRPLSDKQYQQTELRKLLDFLRATSYNNSSLTSRNFPPSSKEFVQIFNHLYSCGVGPLECALPNSQFEEKVIKIMKELNYPGTISKSHFITLGTLHSWPTVLGVLSFLCNHARMLFTMQNNITEELIFSQKTNEHGFPLDEDEDDNSTTARLRLTAMAECYKGFNNEGREEYEDIYQRYFMELKKCKGVDSDLLQRLEQNTKEIAQEVENLKLQESKTEDLKAKFDDMAAEYKRLVIKISGLEKSRNEVQLQIESSRKDVEQLATKLSMLEEKLRSALNAGGPVEVSELDEKRSIQQEADLRQKLVKARELIAEQENQSWEMETQINKTVSSLEAVARTVNKFFTDENIQAPDGSVLALPSPSDASEEVLSTIIQRLKKVKMETLEMISDNQMIIRKLEYSNLEKKQNLEAKQKNLARTKQRIEQTMEARFQTTKKFTEEEAEVEKKIVDTKILLAEIREDENVKSATLEKEIDIVAKRVEDAHKKRIENRKENAALLEEMKKDHEHMESTCQRMTDEAIRVFDEKVLERERMYDDLRKRQEEVDKVLK